MITAEALRDARVAAGYRSQEALAEALGVSSRTITAWEAKGSQVPVKEEARVRALLWPTPAPLSSFEDWEILSELGRRLSHYSKAATGSTQVDTVANPDAPPIPNPEQSNDGASGQQPRRKQGRGARRPDQR